MSSAEVFFYKWWKEKRKNPNITLEEIGETPDDFRFIIDTYTTGEEKTDFHDKLDKKRHSGKQTNYSSMYGIGKDKLAKDLGITVKEATKLIEAYWIKNKCVRTFSGSCETKTVNGQLWVKNPLNNYYYSLRSTKDIFSTVNQGTGDYIFTLWQHNLMSMGVILYAGFHDEIVTCCKSEDCDIVIDKLKKAMERVNKQLNLQVPVGIDYKIGNSYSEVH
jgi:DNA polymerase-1